MDVDSPYRYFCIKLLLLKYSTNNVLDMGIWIMMLWSAALHIPFAYVNTYVTYNMQIYKTSRIDRI